jgi:hypothetical protein
VTIESDILTMTIPIKNLGGNANFKWTIVCAYMEIGDTGHKVIKPHGTLDTHGLKPTNSGTAVDTSGK